MGLGEYLAIVQKRWRLLALVITLCVTAQVVRTALAEELFTARTRVFVSANAGGTASDLVQSSMFVERRMQSYSEVIRSELVLTPVIDKLGLDITARNLASKVQTSVIPETVLIDIRVMDTDPAEAARLSNAIAVEFQRIAGGLDPDSPGLSSSVLVTVLDAAVVPSSPTEPSWKLNLALGLLLGIIAGLAALAIIDALDTKVRSQRDVMRITRAPILGSVGLDPDAKEHPLVVQADPQSRRAESFRQLRTNLQFIAASGHRKVFVITSSVPGEGKSTVAANLAITLSLAGGRVCLVDADLRRPGLGLYMGLEQSIGLTSVLVGEVSLADALQPWGTRVHVLLSGRLPPNPSELLASAGMRSVIDQLEATHDVVVIDSPPLLPVTDAAILARHVGGAIIVVGSNLVDRDELTAAVAEMESIGTEIHGVVVNRVAQGPNGIAGGIYGERYGGDNLGPWIDPIDPAPEPKARARRKAAAPKASVAPAASDDPLVPAASPRRSRAIAASATTPTPMIEQSPDLEAADAPSEHPSADDSSAERPTGRKTRGQSKQDLEVVDDRSHLSE